MELILIDHWGEASSFLLPLGDDSALGDWKKIIMFGEGVIKANLSSKAILKGYFALRL